jgi:hypothetical protein
MMRFLLQIPIILPPAEHMSYLQICSNCSLVQLLSQYD